VLFEYRYFGSTSASSGAVASSISFAPDTRRDPTFLTGTLRKKLPFRETISALHAVVVSDLRFRPRDRTEYLAWREKQDVVDLAELAAAQRDNQAQITAIRAELDELRRRQQGRWGSFRAAQKRFFDWLFKKSVDAWFVLDPVITVHPDEVAFECFSQDESSYGRLACSHEVFHQLGELAYGTTNVDYSYTLYDEFQKIRDDKETTFQVDPAGFEVQTGEDETYREVKIDLPDSWVRGFLQVTTSMVLPGAVRLQLHPMDVHNLCFVLRRHKETHGPRSLRFLLDPGRPVRVLVEPFGLEVACPRSTHDCEDAREVRIWGRRRLLVLERLIPVARTISVVLIGSGMPSFWIADCGDLTFTLGLSGWTANDWSSSGNFDLLAPRGEVDGGTASAVIGALRERWRASSDELSIATGFDRGTVDSAMVAYTQAGRAVYDLRNGVWRLRELSREPLDLGSLRFSNEREAAAAELARAGQVQVRVVGTAGGRVTLAGRVGSHEPTLALDGDRRLVDGQCGCRFHFQNKLRKGPCEHILALRLAHERGLAAPWVEVPVAPPRPKPRVAQPAPAPPPNPRTLPGMLGQLIRRKPASAVRTPPSGGPWDLDEEPNEASAILKHRSAVSLAGRIEVGEAESRITGRIRGIELWMKLDGDGLMVDGECSCLAFRQTRMRTGPCEHLYALKIAWNRQRRAPEPVGGADAPEEREAHARPDDGARVVRRAAGGRDDEGFVALLIERGLLELDPTHRAAFVDAVHAVVSSRSPAEARARRIWQLLEGSVAVIDFYLLDEEDLVVLLKEWG
jgi:predicted nucleic acid-binding Zn finger protein